MLQLKKLRFAPAPSGDIHIGHLWVLYFNFYLAGESGKVFLRIDDTNATVNKNWFKNLIWITEAMNFNFWKIFKQSDRFLLYKNFLIQSGARYSKGAWIIRTNKDSYFDEIRGKRLEKKEDRIAILLRGTGEASYHLASVVDDHIEGITDIVRSNDHLDNSFLHNRILKSLGSEVKFWHLPLLESESGEKISKRKGNFYPVIDLIKDEGILPDSFKVYFESSSKAVMKGRSKPIRFDINLLREINKDLISREGNFEKINFWAKITKNFCRLEVLKSCQHMIYTRKYKSVLKLLQEFNKIYEGLILIQNKLISGQLTKKWRDILLFLSSLESEDIIKFSKNIENSDKIEFRGILGWSSSPAFEDLILTFKNIINGGS